MKVQALIEEHHALQQQLAEDPAGIDLARVLDLIERTRQAGRTVESPPRRDQLRAILRHWGAFVHEQSGEFPPAQLAPFEGAPGRAALLRVLARFWPVMLLIASAVIVLVVWVSRLPSVQVSPATPTPTDVPTSTPKPISPPIWTPTLTPVATPTPTPTALPTLPPTLTPVVTPTPDLSRPQAITPDNAGQVVRLRTLTGHEGAVLSLAFSPDGRHLVSGSADGTVRMWTVEGRQPPVVLATHTGWVRAVAFNPDGRLIASGGNDRIVRLWDLDTAQVFAELDVREGFVFDLTFYPGGRVLTTSSGAGALDFWDVESGSQLATIRRGESAVYAIGFSPDGALFAAAGADGVLTVLADPPGGPEWCSWTGAPVRALAFGPYGRQLAAVDEKGEVVVLDVTGVVDSVACPRVGGWPAHPDGVNDVAYSPTGLLLVTAGEDGLVRLWTPSATRTDRATLQGHQAAVRAVAFDPDGRILASAGADGTIILWGLLR